MHLESVIELVYRYALGGCNRASVEIHLEAVIERDWTSTWKQSMDGAPGADTLFIS